jgi:hypothetical protein
MHYSNFVYPLILIIPFYYIEVNNALLPSSYSLSLLISMFLNKELVIVKTIDEVDVLESLLIRIAFPPTPNMPISLKVVSDIVKDFILSLV